MGFKQIIEPVDLANGRIRLHGMPCYNTQIEQYGSKLIRDLIANINSHSGVNIVMVHNPDGVRKIEEAKKNLGLSIDVPTLFLCGHTHGLLGFQDVRFVGNKLSNKARDWIGME
jgi:predicted MPP superfamily phosphohydrolase